MPLPIVLVKTWPEGNKLHLFGLGENVTFTLPGSSFQHYSLRQWLIHLNDQAVDLHSGTEEQIEMRIRERERWRKLVEYDKSRHVPKKVTRLKQCEDLVSLNCANFECMRLE